MSTTTSIEWTDTTWNPVTGCRKISPGCDNCYAERFAERFLGVPGHPYEQGFDLKTWPERLVQPLGWRQPRRVFVNSMSDLFHKSVPEEFLTRIFEVMERAERHQFQVLTKRSSRLKNFLNRRYSDRPAPDHMWFGVSVENRAAVSRIRHLVDSCAAIKFLSVEPLLGDLGPLKLAGVDWVIVGGESGPRFRHMEAEWARSVRDQCTAAGVPFFFKQWGGIRPKSGGNRLDGRVWSQFPQTHPSRLGSTCPATRSRRPTSR